MMCPRSRAGFPWLGETRLHLVEVGLRFSFTGVADHECKSPLKCTAALNSCGVSVSGQQPGGRDGAAEQTFS